MGVPAAADQLAMNAFAADWVNMKRPPCGVAEMDRQKGATIC